MAYFHVISGAETARAHPEIRRLDLSDLRYALARGWGDFWAMPSHLFFMGLIYPVIGMFLGRLVVDNNIMPLLFPLAAGFALLGPLAAIGLYEISKRRERSLEVHWREAFAVLHAPSLGAIIALAGVLVALFLSWLASAQAIYQGLFGYGVQASIPDFIHQVLTTEAGHRLILLGCGVGFLHALAVLVISVVSFPMLVDRDVGGAVAVATSVRVVLANPLIMAVWGVVLAGGLVLGSLAFFVGLAVVIPVLGHASWHLYRRAVGPDRA